MHQGIKYCKSREIDGQTKESIESETWVAFKTMYRSFGNHEIVPSWKHEWNLFHKTCHIGSPCPHHMFWIIKSTWARVWSWFKGNLQPKACFKVERSCDIHFIMLLNNFHTTLQNYGSWLLVLFRWIILQSIMTRDFIFSIPNFKLV